MNDGCPTRFVVMLCQRFDNPSPMPIFSTSSKKSANGFIRDSVKKDCQNKVAISEWFNGHFTEREIRKSFMSDYSVVEVPSDH